MPPWFTAIIEFVRDEWQTVITAPATFVTGSLIIAVVIWVILTWQYGARLDNKDAIIGSRDATIKFQEAQLAEYRTKLKGASPDEAAAQLDSLKNKVAHMQEELLKVQSQQASQAPRRITSDQTKLFINLARVYKGNPPFIAIQHDIQCIDCSAYAQDFCDLINNVAGWRAEMAGSVVGVGFVSSGITIRVNSKDNLSPEITVLINAMKAAGLQFDILENLRQRLNLPGIATSKPWDAAISVHPNR
jgi:hypothetical protein